MRKLTFLLAGLVLTILVCVSATAATIEPVGPFSGQLSEGFETQQVSFSTELPVFGGESTVRNLLDGPYLHISGCWTGIGTVCARSGICFMGSVGGGVEWIFDMPAGRFGGYFTVLNLLPNTEGAVANFYDVNDNLLAQMDVNAPYSTWIWNGWVSDVPIKRVEIIGLGSSGWLDLSGFVMHDDMEYTPFGEPGTIHYVDDDATGANDGSSWEDAFNYLQDALAAAHYGDQILVAQGIYKPDHGAGQILGDRNATFQLINGVTIKGGYAGSGEPDPDDRDIYKYKSILSGDLNGNDIPVANPEDLWYDSSRAENSFHVVTGSGMDEIAVLEGFTITGGYAESPNKYGGGMYNYSGRPTISSCIFTKNWAEDNGGGMYNSQSSPLVFNCKFIGNYTDEDDDDEGGSGMCNEASRPTLINCVFSDNWASFQGGGMYNRGDSRPRLINCVFSNNIGYQGGGMSNWHSNTTLIECTFSRNEARTGGGMENGWSSLTIRSCMFSANEAGYGGGAMFNYRSSPTLTNCIFSGNLAGWRGGGIENWTNNSLTVFNCTFYSNSADEGNTLACWSWPQDPPSELFLTNCILWDGGNEIWNNDNSAIAINYSDVQGGWEGEGNIEADPLFVEPRFWEANGVLVDGDYHLLPDSPCIDAGDPNYIAEPNETDLDGNPRVINGRIDMGAYEYSPPIPAEVDIEPDTLNLTSKGKLITCYIWLPEDYNVADIDPNSVFLENEIGPQRFWFSEDNQIAIAKFDREEVQSILDISEVELTITGRLTGGTIFEGTDTIKVIDKGSGKSSK